MRCAARFLRNWFVGCALIVGHTTFYLIVGGEGARQAEQLVLADAGQQQNGRGNGNGPPLRQIVHVALLLVAQVEDRTIVATAFGLREPRDASMKAHKELQLARC